MTPDLDEGEGAGGAAQTVDTPIGPLYVEATEVGVAAIGFRSGPARSGPPAAVAKLRRAAAELTEYFGGDRAEFSVPLDWSATSGFRLEVLRRLRQVPFGEVVSYGELAALAGRPGAARAVGTTMAHNPLPIVVPCHRVIRSGGELGRYGNDPELKVWLLVHEGYLQPEGDDER
jgi:methylated-DNA-[protein]-cysteine S-methyltransferase